MRQLIQIVAGLPPAFDGVGDYALAIARALRDRQEIKSLFVVANPGWHGPSTVEGFPAIRVARKDPVSLLLALQGIHADAGAEPTTPVLFHCSMYGYATRALAFWVQRGLSKWKHETPDSPLITMFHELVADGPIWGSAFWLRGIQVGLIRRFARASVASLTSNARYRLNLARIAGIEESRIVRLPVLSTIGEPRELHPVRKRKRQLVIFGKPQSRDLTFSRCLPALDSACRTLGIERVLEVGPDPSKREQRLPVAVEATGALSAGEASALLRDSQFGFIASDASILCKSTVFAAYCAHGMVPVVAGRDDGEGDELYANRHYLSSQLQGGLGDDDLEAVSQAAQNWYRGHGLAAQASQYASILAPTPELIPAGENSLIAASNM